MADIFVTFILVVILLALWREWLTEEHRQKDKYRD